MPSTEIHLFLGSLLVLTFTVYRKFNLQASVYEHGRRWPVGHPEFCARPCVPCLWVRGFRMVRIGAGRRGWANHWHHGLLGEHLGSWVSSTICWVHVIFHWFIFQNAILAIFEVFWDDNFPMPLDREVYFVHGKCRLVASCTMCHELHNDIPLAKSERRKIEDLNGWQLLMVMYEGPSEKSNKHLSDVGWTVLMGFIGKQHWCFSKGSCESIIDLYKANQIQDHSVFPARQSHAVDPKWTIDLTRCTAWPTGSQIWGPFQISKGENNIWGPFQIPKEEISSIPHTGLKYLIYNCYFHFYFGISWAR